MNLGIATSGFGLAVAASVACCSAEPTGPVVSAPKAAAPTAPPSAPVSTAPAAPAPASSAPTDLAAAGPLRLTSHSVPLPGAEGPASLDYIVYERANSRVWVPVGATGSVDVFDTAHGNFTRVDGFKTIEREMHGKKRTMGPSAATVGDGVVYIGDRASSEVCPIDLKTLRAARCLPLSSPTDGVAYVASAREVWVTTPRDQTVTILDASKPESLRTKATIKTDGAPEGYAIDEAHGRFFTNLEDKGGTLAIDIKTRNVTATWNAGCSADGPRGVAFDATHDFVVVACTDHLQILDAAHDGAPLGKLDTGAGVDNVDLVDATVYVAAGKAARLTIATIDGKGQFAIVATGDTSEGVRNAVADERGDVYVADAQGARLLVFPAPTR